MPTEREISIQNNIVLDIAVRHDEVGGEEASKGKYLPFYVRTVTGKGDNLEKDVPVSDGDMYRHKLLRDIAK